MSLDNPPVVVRSVPSDGVIVPTVARMVVIAVSATVAIVAQFMVPFLSF